MGTCCLYSNLNLEKVTKLKFVKFTKGWLLFCYGSQTPLQSLWQFEKVCVHRSFTSEKSANLKEKKKIWRLGECGNYFLVLNNLCFLSVWKADNTEVLWENSVPTPQVSSHLPPSFSLLSPQALFLHNASVLLCIPLLLLCAKWQKNPLQMKLKKSYKCRYMAWRLPFVFLSWRILKIWLSQEAS